MQVPKHCSSELMLFSLFFGNKPRENFFFNVDGLIPVSWKKSLYRNIKPYSWKKIKSKNYLLACFMCLTSFHHQNLYSHAQLSYYRIILSFQNSADGSLAWTKPMTAFGPHSKETYSTFPQQGHFCHPALPHSQYIYDAKIQNIHLLTLGILYFTII